MRLISTALAAALMMATPVVAQNMSCIPDAAASIWLEQNQMELASSGQAGQVIIQVWADPRTRRFVIIALPQEGVACMLAGGDGYRQYPWGNPV